MRALATALAALLASPAVAGPISVFGISCDSNCPGGTLVASATALGVTRIRSKIAIGFPLTNVTTGASLIPTNAIDPDGVTPAGSGLTWQFTDQTTGAPFSANWHVGDTVSSAALPGMPGTALIASVLPNVPSVTLDTTVLQYVHGPIGSGDTATAAAAAAAGMSMELSLIHLKGSANTDEGPYLETDAAFRARVLATIQKFQATGVVVDLISVADEENGNKSTATTNQYLAMMDNIHTVAAALSPPIPVTNGGLASASVYFNYWDYLWETCATTACRRAADVFAAGAFIKTDFQARIPFPTTCDGSGNFLTGNSTNYQLMRKTQTLITAYAARPWLAYTNLHWYQVPPGVAVPALQLAATQAGHPPYFNQFNLYSQSGVDQQAMMAAIYGLGAFGVEPTTASPTALHAVSLQALDGTLYGSGKVFKAFAAAPASYTVAGPDPVVTVC